MKGLPLFVFAMTLLACESPDKIRPRGEPVTVRTNEPPSISTVTSASTQPPVQSDIERGKYLATIGGCNDCHTPKKMGAKGPELDESRLLSGHVAAEKMTAAPKSAGWPVAVNGTFTAWSGPWGRSYAANLTPDPETGIGKWTEEQFVEAIRSGKHLGGRESREILPPMPWTNYAVMTSADLKALFAYLRSIPPVKNAVPAAMPAPPPQM